MSIQNVTFLCACPKHGVDVHDGSKNECCDSAIVLPTLSNEEFDKLVPNGKQQFESDLLALAKLVESGAIDLQAVPSVYEWYHKQGFPRVESQLRESEMRDQTSDTVGEETAEEQQPEFNPDAYYMAGFEQGFAMGFEKGFDTGHKLSVQRK